MKYIKTLDRKVPVQLLLRQLALAQQIWNYHSDRTKRSHSPHHDASDIWVRYNESGRISALPHESAWYPHSAHIPAVREIVAHVMQLVRGERLGGVLITKIPAGGCVLPHIDEGWHANYYTKYAVQLQSHPDQAFCFEDGQHKTVAGDVYQFDNSQLHWVTNNSPIDRITLIICIKPETPAIEGV